MLTRKLRAEAQDCGIRLPNIAHKINHLFFADDLILFGKNNDELRKLVRLTTEWATQYKLEINESKTETIALNTGRNPQIQINGVTIQNSNPTYLGFTLDSRMRGTEHMKQRVRKGKQSLYATLATLKRTPHLKITTKAIIIRACILSVLGYGTEGSYIPKACRKQVEQLDILQRKAARMLLNTP